MKTTEKLAQALHSVGLFKMEALARAGRYDDFESKSATPCVDLVSALRNEGQDELAQRAKDGEWDCTEEEGEEWFKRSGVPGRSYVFPRGDLL